ncbi:MAG: nicotinate-nucleotide--dimethylbenzimidazole phosphoribosyltransferase [Bdellovibrionales bacterium]|nr:nicotinate-nucleotide--dimethylbenzimidazole phosphoribosyltransferase [Bdellovibrionales bacterium]
MELPQITPTNMDIFEKAREKILTLTMPTWALGDLLDLAQKLCAISSRIKPQFKNKKVFIFAADHGVTEEGVSQYPSEVTAQMVANFMNEGAAINVLAKHAGASTIVVDMGVKSDLSEFVKQGKLVDKKMGPGTKNFAKELAMTKEQAYQCIQTGIDIVLNTEMNTDLYAIGEMGIGNTTSASAIISTLLDLPVNKCTGKGTGVDESTLHKKIKVIEETITKHHPDMHDPYDVLSKVGGFEIGAMTGMILGASHMKKPILIDGVITMASALLAYRLNPLCKDYMILSHRSVEPAYEYAAKEMGLTPLIDLNMRLGEGSGTPLAMNLIDASCKILNEMATFESAGVSSQKDPV